MSIDSQLKEMRAMAERDGLNVAELKQESHSAKNSGTRPVFNELLNDLRETKFDGILTWAPDRLSRNAGDLGSLVDLMDQNKLKQIRTYGQSFCNTPNEKFLLMILCSQAKLENDNRGVNVKRGIRAKCEMGWRPCMPPLGYYTRGSTGSVKDVIIDAERAPFIAEMFEMSAAGKSGRHIKQWLIDNDIRTRKDKIITLSMIYKMLKSTFYYGEFEYPKNSGKWYKGSHESLITKELFEDVQKALVVPLKSKWGAKEFPFRRFLTCASCGSHIVGEEKFKTRVDGGKNRHVYYHCSRQVKYNCPEPYVRQELIIEELLRMCSKLSIQAAGCEPGLVKAIQRYSAMMKSTNHDFKSSNALSGYTKYVLEQGSEFEKTRLIRNLELKLTLHNRKLAISSV